WPHLRDPFEKIWAAAAHGGIQSGRLEISGLRQDGREVGCETTSEVLLVRFTGEAGNQDQGVIHMSGGSLYGPVGGQGGCKHGNDDQNVNWTEPARRHGINAVRPPWLSLCVKNRNIGALGK